MGYFYKMFQADVFILSNDVPYAPRNMDNYNYIKNPQGRHRITMPISANEGDILETVMIRKDTDLLNRLRENIYQNYRRAPYFDLIYPDILDIFEWGFDRLVPFNVQGIGFLANKFGYKGRIEFAPKTGLKRDERIFRLCEICGADTYLSGHGAAAYHDPAAFAVRGIRLMYVDYEPVEYPQRFGPFESNLSVLDWIFNMGYILPEGWVKNG